MTGANVQEAIQEAIRETEVAVNEWLKGRDWREMEWGGESSLTKRMDMLFEWHKHAERHLLHSVAHQAHFRGEGDEPFVMTDERRDGGRRELIVHTGLIDIVTSQGSMVAVEWLNLHGARFEASRNKKIFVNDQLVAVAVDTLVRPDNWRIPPYWKSDISINVRDSTGHKDIIPGWRDVGGADGRFVYRHETGAEFLAM